MFRIGLKSFLAKKFRLISTTLAVMLGIAFLSGSLVLIDTLGKTFDDLIAGIFENVDAQVRSTELLETQFVDLRGPIEASLLDEVRAVDGVAAAAGSTEGFAQIVGSDGEALGNPAQGAPTLGLTWTVEPELNPMVLQGSESRPPVGPSEVVIDKASADAGRLAVGDPVTILLQEGPRQFDLVGIAKFGEADSAAGASMAFFETETAQRLLGDTEHFSTIDVIATEGVTQAEIQTRISAVMPSGVEVLTGEDIIEENQSAINEALSFFNTFMLVFAGIALFVGAFIIYNTFSIIVAQRVRELALLRALGASARQVLSSVMFEAILVAILASIVGIVAGLGVAIGLKQLLAFFGIDIPTGPVVFTPATVVISMIVGLVVTTVSAVVPAIRAARTPPMAAIREIATDTSSRSVVRFAIGGVLTALGIGAIMLGLFASVDNPIQTVGVGAVAVFLGMAALTPIIVAPVAWVLGRLLTALRGFPGQLAGENAGRNPKRTSSTASALMIGIALVGFITVFAASTRDSIDKIIDDSITGDIVIESSSFGFGGLSPDLATQLASLPEVESVAAIRAGFAEVNGEALVLFSSDPATIGRVLDVGVLEGRLEDLDETAIAVHTDVAADNGWTLGDPVPARFTDTGAQTLNIAVIYEESSLTGDYFVGNPAYDANFSEVFDFQIYIETTEGAASGVAREAIEAVAAPYANASVLDLSEFRDSQSEGVDQLLGLIYALLGLSILIAVLGIANTLALSIVERTHELGLLRAVGMTRRQVRAAVRWESVIIALLGTGLGIAIGTFFGWAVVRALRDEGISVLSVPLTQLVVIAVLGALVGVLAAVGPARRAAKLNVLRAISTE